MSRHSFDPEIAAQTSIAAAVIFQNISFWCEKNEANGRHLHEGKTWSYNSISAFEKLFPYLTKSQIRTALEKLEEAGFIEVGVFNEDPRDKTKWYAISRTCICEKSQMELSEIADPFAKNRKPLPDIKPNIKHTPQPPEGEDDLFGPSPKKNETQSGQEPGPLEVLSTLASPEVAAEFVAHRKEIKSPLTARAARAMISKLASHPDPDSVLLESISQGWKGVFPEKVQPRGQGSRVGDLTDRQRRMLQDGVCPPTLKDPNGNPNATARHWLQRYGHGGHAA